MSDELEPSGLHPVLELGVEVISVSAIRQQSNNVLYFGSGDNLAPSVLLINECCSTDFSFWVSTVYRMKHTVVASLFYRQKV